MLTYATFAEYARMKVVDEDDYSDTGRRVIETYLRRATGLIERATRRMFFPLDDTHAFPIPIEFADLRRRIYPFDDLMLDNDLLEARTVQTGSAAAIETTETLLSTLAAAATSFTAADADGQDINGNVRYTVGDILQIENERMRVIAVDTGTNLITLQRAILGTLAAAHAAGTTVYKLSLSILAAGIDYHLLDLNFSPKWAVRLVWPNAWGGGYGTGWRGSLPQIFIAGMWGYHEDRNPWVNTLDIVPVGGLTSSATSFTVSDADGDDANGDPRFETGMLLRCDDELLEVSDVNTTTEAVSVVRGVRGTIPAAHTAGTSLLRWQVLPEISGACASIAKVLRDADASVGGRQGVSEMSAGAKITMPEDVNGVLAMYQRAIV